MKMEQGRLQQKYINIIYLKKRIASVYYEKYANVADNYFPNQVMAMNHGDNCLM